MGPERERGRGERFGAFDRLSVRCTPRTPRTPRYEKGSLSLFSIARLAYAAYGVLAYAAALAPQPTPLHAAQAAHLSHVHGHLRERWRRDALSDVMRLAAADDDDRRGVHQARDSAHMRSDAKCRCEPSSCIAAARSERSAWPAAASSARGRRVVCVSQPSRTTLSRAPCGMALMRQVRDRVHAP